MSLPLPDFYDPKQVSYEKLLYVYWRNVDPLTKNGQFCDFGTQYRTAIFYTGDAQRALAEASKAALEKAKKFSRPIVTGVLRDELGLCRLQIIVRLGQLLILLR